MRSFKLALGFFLMASAAAAQSYPSPTFSSFNINGTATWINSYVPGFSTATIPAYIIAPSGNNSAIFSANRASDNVAGGAQNIISDTCLAVANAVQTLYNSWCRYSQINVPAGSTQGLIIGEENSIANNRGSNAAALDPFSTGYPGTDTMINLRLNTGTGPTFSYNTSSFIHMSYNGGKALAGLVVQGGALDTSGNPDGIAPVISMPQNTGFKWYNSLGAIGWKIFANTSSGVGQIILGDNGTSGSGKFDLYLGASGDHPLSISGGTITANNNINITGSNALLLNGVSTIDNLAWTTFTPTLSCITGTLTSGSAGGRYKTIGKTVFFTMIITETTLGTCNIIQATLPITKNSSAAMSATGRETGTTGKMVQAFADAGSSTLFVQDTAGTAIGGNGYQFKISGTYEAN